LRDTTGLRCFGWHEARKITPLPADVKTWTVDSAFESSQIGGAVRKLFWSRSPRVFAGRCAIDYNLPKLQ
jgi:hypothetical protein